MKISVLSATVKWSVDKTGRLVSSSGAVRTFRAVEGLVTQTELLQVDSKNTTTSRQNSRVSTLGATTVIDGGTDDVLQNDMGESHDAVRGLSSLA